MFEEEEEEEIYLAQTQQIKYKYKSFTYNWAGLPENPKVNYAGHPNTSTSWISKITKTTRTILKLNTFNCHKIH